MLWGCVQGKRAFAAAARVTALAFGLATASGCLPGLTGGVTPSERVAQLTVDEARPALKQLDAPEAVTRESACRALAADAERLRRLGDVDGAERHVHWIVDRFERESDLGVKYAIVALCAPVMGRGGSPLTELFLRERIASGDLAGPAALVLADIAPENAYGYLAPLTEHPLPTMRADAALALTVLGDVRGAAAVWAVVEDMKASSAWPRRIWGVPLEEARTNLVVRAERAFGKKD